MNLALRDVRHNKLRFVMTAIGVGMLLAVVLAMTGVYEGALDDALRLPRQENAELWVVQPNTYGPFAEPSRIPLDTRDLIQRIPGVASVGAVTFQTVQTVVDERPVRMLIQGFESGRLGGPQQLVAGSDLTRDHYQIVVDASSGLHLGDRVPLGPLHDIYTVVGLTQGMVTSAGDPVSWVSLLDAQSLQFQVPPPLERREKAAGRPPAQTADINAVLVRLLPGAAQAEVVAEIERWKHLAAVTEAQQETYLTKFVIERMQRQLGMFLGILVTVAGVVLALIIYTMTMDKLRSIATLKLIGAPDRTIVGLIMQQALILGISAFVFGTTMILMLKGLFPRRLLIEPRDVGIVFLIVIVVCLLASTLGVRAAVKVEPAQALAG
ncbi:MAG: ABC transporter permease [Rhodopila sp.]|nr:ABC transporter permease [Rhodopila sp.]